MGKNDICEIMTIFMDLMRVFYYTYTSIYQYKIIYL